MEKFTLMACPGYTFARAVKAWREQRKQAPFEIDPRMLYLLDRFNAIPGLVSIYSCEGHPEDTRPGRKRRGRTWIRFLASMEGLPNALELYDRILKHPAYIGDREVYPYVRLTLTNETLRLDDAEIVVPAFVLSLPANAPHLKDTSLKLLRDVLDDMVQTTST